MKKYSKYQQKVIQRYYENREQIDEQRLSELVTSLYLAEKKKQTRLWKSATEIMLRLNVPRSRVDHVIHSANPVILAEVVKDIQNGVFKK